jgi:hypothetical protein
MPPPSDDEVIVQGASIVSGNFTGNTRLEIKTYRNMFDDQGKPIDYKEVITVLEFRVKELIDGQKTDEIIQVRFVGGESNGIVTPMATSQPKGDAPVALSLMSEDEGYIPVHGRVFDLSQRPSANEDDFRTRVRQLRRDARAKRQASQQGEIQAEFMQQTRGSLLETSGSLVHGTFTGRTKREEAGVSQPQIDDEGRPTPTTQPLVDWFEFQVEDTLAGQAEGLIWVRLPDSVRGATGGPRGKELGRMILNINDDGDGRFTIVGGMLFDGSDAELKALRASLQRKPTSPRNTAPEVNDR